MRVFAALFLGYVLSIFYRSFLSVIATPVMSDLAIGPRELGFISAAWFVTFALMQFPVGWALDRLGARLTVGSLMAVGVAGAVLFATAEGPQGAGLAMALIGIGCSPIFMAALYLFARENPPERFAAVASLFVGFGSIGNLLGAAPLGRAADAFGWRPTMLVLAAGFLLALALAVWLIRDPARVDGQGSAGEGLIAGLRQIMTIRAFWLLAPITFTSYAILATTRGLWVAPFLGDVTGSDRAAQGEAALLMAVAMTAGAFVFGSAEKRLGGPKRTVALSTGVVAALFVVLAVAGHVSSTVATALFAAIGLAGFSYAILMAHARLFFPPHLIGRGMTFMNFFFIAGAAAIQAGSGWFIASGQEAGRAAAAVFSDLHLGFAALLAASLAVYLRAPTRPA